MKTEARFADKTSESTDDIWQLTVMHGEMTVTISVNGDGLRVMLDRPLGKQLVVTPQASNVISIHARREG